MMTPEQKAEAVAIFGKGKRVNSIDYVAAWYWKAAEYMGMRLSAASTRPEGRIPVCQAAFVSTNSITQGEQVAPVFRPLVERHGFTIDFAHRTFVWNSDSDNKAHVHCVIIGFSCGDNSRAKSSKSAKDISEEPSRTSREEKQLFDGERVSLVPHINAYLVPAPDAFVESRAKPLCDVPPMTYGNKPSDDGNLLLSEPERDAILRETPALAPFLRRYVGARDFIANDEIRYCLWLKDASPALYHGNREVMRRLAAVRDFRLASVKAATRKAAETAWQFMEIKEPKSDYVLIPAVSSEQRRYVPIGYLPPEVTPTNLANFVPDATLYHFGVLTSNVHMAWMRAVAGRLEMRYRYSAQIVYNNFPWPFECKMENGEWKIGGEASASSAPLRLCVEKISSTAQGILDARARYPDASLADLYDELTMPPDLRRAHQENDRAVMAAYGFSTKMTESECVSALFGRYAEAVARKDDGKRQ